MPTTFMECTSLSISYDVMGLATVNYVIVSDSPDIVVYNQVEVGDPTVQFDGYATNVSHQKIPNTDWYETNVTLIAVAN